MNVVDLVEAVLEKKDYTARLVSGVSNYIHGYHQALIDITEEQDSAWLCIYDIKACEVFQSWCRENTLPDNKGKTIGFVISDGVSVALTFAGRNDINSDFSIMNVPKNFYPKYWMPLPKIKINNVYKNY